VWSTSVALEGARDDWLDYEKLLAEAPATFTRPAIAESDLLTINYTSGTTARPKGVMITHRNAWVNSIGTLVHLDLGVGERYLWTLPMFHANGWTFTWTVTAAAAVHVCLRRVEPAHVFQLVREEGISWLCAAPTILIGMANAPADVRGELPTGVHVVTAGAPPGTGDDREGRGRARLGGDPGLWADRRPRPSSLCALRYRSTTRSQPLNERSSRHAKESSC